MEQGLKDKESSPSETSLALINFFRLEFPLGGTTAEHRFIHQIFPLLIQRVFGPPSAQSRLLSQHGIRVEAEENEEERRGLEAAWLLQTRQWRSAMNPEQSRGKTSFSTLAMPHGSTIGSPKLEHDPVVELLSPPTDDDALSSSSMASAHASNLNMVVSSSSSSSKPLTFFRLLLMEDSLDFTFEMVKNAHSLVRFNDLSFQMKQELLQMIIDESNTGNQFMDSLTSSLSSSSDFTESSNARHLLHLCSVPLLTQKDLVSHLKLILQQIYPSAYSTSHGILSSPSRNLPLADTMLSPSRSGINVTITTLDSLEETTSLQTNFLEYYLFMFVRCPLVMGEMGNLARQTSSTTYTNTNTKSTSGGVSSSNVYNYSPNFRVQPYGEKVYLHLLKEYLSWFVPHVFEKSNSVFAFNARDDKNAEFFLRLIIECWLNRHVYPKTIDGIRNHVRDSTLKDDPGIKSLDKSFDLAELLPVGQYWNLKSNVLTRQVYTAGNKHIYKAIRILVDHIISDPCIKKARKKTDTVDDNRNEDMDWPLPLCHSILQPSLFNYIRTGLRYGPIHVSNSSFYQAMDLWLLWIEPWNVVHRRTSSGALHAKELLQNVGVGAKYMHPSKQQVRAVNQVPKPNQPSKYDKSWESFIAANLHFYLVPLSIFLRRAREFDFSKLDFNKSIIHVQRVMRVFSAELVKTIDTILLENGDANLNQILLRHEKILGDFCPPRRNCNSTWTLEMLQADMQIFLEEVIQSHRKTVREQDLADRIGAFIEGLFGEGSKAEDKILNQVISTAKGIVKFPNGHVIIPEMIRDGFFSRRSLADANTISEGIANQYTPDREKNGQISDKGRSQLIHGIRKCSAVHVNFLGDPMYARPKTYEIETLVRFSLYLSNRLNVYFGFDTPRKIRLYGQDGSWDVAQLVKDEEESVKSGSFRFNLRFLSDTRNWAVIWLIFWIMKRKIFA